MATDDWQEVTDDWEDVSTPSAAESLGRGALQGATLGFSDEAIAGMRSIPSQYELESQAASGVVGETGNIPEKYKERVSQERAANIQAKAAHPGAFLGGELAGGFAVPSSGIAKSVATGALGGYGQADGDVIDQGLSTIVGGAAGGMGGAVGKVAEKGIPALRQFAQRQATESTKMTPTMLQRLKDKGLSEEVIGRFLLDRGIVTPGASVETMATRLGGVVETEGKKIGDIIAKAESEGAAKVPLRGVAEEVRGKYAGQLDSVFPALRENAEKVMKQLDGFQGKLRPEDFPTISEAQKLKTELGKVIDWKGGDPLKDIYWSLSNKIDSTVEETLGVTGMAASKEAYHIGSALERPMEYGAAKEGMYPAVGMKQMMAGASAGSLSGSGLFGVGAGVASEVGRRYGRQTAAFGADMVAKNLDKVPEKFRTMLQNAASKGQNSLAVTDYVLSQIDPEYQAAKRQMQEGQTEWNQ